MNNHLFDTLLGGRTRSTATVFETANTTVTYADLTDRASQIAGVLTDHGLAPGDRVAAQVAKSVDAIALYLATVMAGGVFLPLNTGYTLREVDYFLTDATPKILACDPESHDHIRPVADRISAHVLTLDASGHGSLIAAAKTKSQTFEPIHRAPDDLAGILYTSGTTGRSKGAMISHRNLASNACTLRDAWQVTASDTLIHALPIFHTHGLFVAINTCLAAGAAMRFHESFDLDRIIADMPRSTMLMGVPTFYTRLLDDPRLTSDLTRNMRLFTSGSAPLLAETHQAFEARTGQRILERYGMTETNMNTSNPYEGERRAGTVGPPLPGVELRITAPGTTTLVPDGEVGMIEVRGENVFRGYWNMPEKTALELREDGFFITGDLGRRDADGYIHIVGREKDLIITGGYNVYPKEIEEVLNDVPGVLETAVFGLPDADFGEAVIAAVIPEPGAELSVETLKDAAAAALARYKQPRRYEILAALPRNTMGKVQKNLLRTQFGTSA